MYAFRITLALALTLAAARTCAAQALPLLVFPTLCGPTLQACIDEAPPGATVFVATSTPVEEPFVRIRRSVTLAPAPGVAATIRGAIGIEIRDAGDATVKVRDLRVEGSITAVLAAGGVLDVEIARNTLAARLAGIRVSAAGDGGLVRFALRDNTVDVTNLLIAIEVVSFGGSRAEGVVAGNVVRTSAATSALALAARGDLRALVAHNVISGPGHLDGIRVAALGGRGEATVVGNLVTGQRGGSGAAIATLGAAGSLRISIVGNTVTDADAGIDVGVRADLGGTLQGVVANNVVAGVALRSMNIDPEAACTNSHNLLSGGEHDFVPGEGTLFADPRFAGPADFRLGPGSPAIDAGLAAAVPLGVTTDLDGAARIVGGRVDLGAFEASCPDGTRPATSCPIEPSPTCDPSACDDGDPCTTDRCDGDRCRHEPLAGPAAAACACRRPPPAACAADALPRALDRATSRACRLLDRVGSAEKRRAAKLVGRAARAWRRAVRHAETPGAARALSLGCSAALSEALRDAVARTEGLR